MTIFEKPVHTLTKEDFISITQEEVNQMSDEQVEKLNELCEEYTTNFLRPVRTILLDKAYIMRWAVKTYYKMKENKVKYAFWRPKAVVELVLMETGLKIEKFTQGFNIKLGSIADNLCYYQISFDKETREPQFSMWYKSFSKKKELTEEEKLALIKKREQERLEELRKQFMRNCEKLGLSENDYGKVLKNKEDRAEYKVIGVNPRNKKFPIKCRVTFEDESKNAIYDISYEYYKQMKRGKR